MAWVRFGAGSMCLLGVGVLGPWGCGPSGPPLRRAGSVGEGGRATSRAAGPRVVEFDEGIRIDYRVPQVEIDGEIILREGPLELFAYAKAPQPKEHESIVLLRSRPRRIYEALGLIGLVPGETSRYYFETGRTRAASGDPVEVLVRHEAGGVPAVVWACDWMMNPATKRAMARRPWLFTGSERFEDGTFFADLEGTVVTVVDFPSSLLGLAEAHSDADSDLWLAANTDAIPPVGTHVVLVLRPAAMTLRVGIGKDGRITLDGGRLEVTALTAAVGARTSGWTDRARIRVDVSAGAAASLVAGVRRALEAAGVRADRIAGAGGPRAEPDGGAGEGATTRPADRGATPFN